MVYLVMVFISATSLTQDHIRALGDLVMEQIEGEGGKSVAFGTPVMSDGITMGIEVDYFFIYILF